MGMIQDAGYVISRGLGAVDRFINPQSDDGAPMGDPAIPVIKDPGEPVFPPSVFVPIGKTRRTQDIDDFGYRSFYGIEPPPDYMDDWNLLDYNDMNVGNIDTDKILLVLKSVSPHISKAHWDFQQFANNQCTPECETPEGQAATEEFIERISQNQGSFTSVIDKMLSGAFIRGSYFFELILDNRFPIDLAVGDPILVRYERRKSRRRGQYWQAGQIKKGEFYPFLHDTVIHAPVNSIISSPYGIPLIDSSIFSALFMVGLLYDIRRVISQQGYYRLDFSIDWEVMDRKIKANAVKPADVDAFIGKRIEEIRKYYDSLEPNDSLAHTSDIEIKDIGGALNTEGLGAINAVIDWLNNQLTLSCKSVPILMGVNNSTSETHANRQWENYMATIRSCQRKLAEKLNQIFTLALRYQGIQDKVTFHFQELSITTAMNMAIYQKQVLDNIDAALNMGVRGLNSEGKEVVTDPVPLMTSEEAMKEWQTTRRLR